MDFAAPHWLWLLIAAPLAAGVATLAWRRRLRATAAWAAHSLWDRLLPTYDRRRLWIWSLTLALALAGVALTLARPRWGATETQIERQGVDLVFVLDTSLSMATRDVQPSRLERAAYLMQASPSRKLDSIALEVGFSAHSDFSRVFKKVHGFSASSAPLSDFRPDSRAPVKSSRPRNLAPVSVTAPFATKR